MKTQTSTRSALSKLSNWIVAIGALCIVVMLLHILFLLRFPPVFVDEAWMASRAYAWIHDGVNVGPLDGALIEQPEEFTHVLPLITTLIHAKVIQAIGLSVLSLRLVSLLAGTALLTAIYAISLELYRSRRGGAITVLLVAVSYPFLYSSHLVRPDIFVAALGFGAIALYLVGRRRYPTALNVLAGLMLGIAFEIHPNAMIYGPIIVALYLVDDKWRFFRKREFWAFVGGTCLGLAGYVWLHILPNPGTYFAIISEPQQTHMPPAASGALTGIALSFLDTAKFLLTGTGGRLIAVMAAIIALWRMQRSKHVQAFTMFAASFVAFAFLIRNKIPYYLILITPFSNVLLGAWIEQTLREGVVTTFWLKRAKAITYSAVVASLLIAGVELALTPPPGDVDLVAERVEQVLPEDALVMGTHTYWFGLHDNLYRTWQQIRAYRRFNPDATFDEAARTLRPDVLIIDDHMRTFILEDPESAPRYARERHLLKKDVDDFLARRGTLVDQFDTAAYGTIEIHTINWHD